MAAAIKKSAVIVLAASLMQLAGCGSAPATQQKSTPYYLDDRPPTHHVDVSQLPDAVPKVEPITAAGNKSPYRIMGKTYHVMPSGRDYQEQGQASWYGSKFHGRKTANGETYNMYAMTAAHKTLPIPSYVKVTDLDTGNSVIVRVNDRGPFLHGRIIDLSYAAAKKLGYADRGVANVEVVAIDPRDYQNDNYVEAPTVDNREQAQKRGNYLQVGAFTSSLSALKLQSRVQDKTPYPVIIKVAGENEYQLFKVLIGPLVNTAKLETLKKLLADTEQLSPFLVHF